MGNLDSFRDWGHSSDYTMAMVKLLNHNSPDDIVISTGTAHSVRDLCVYVFSKLGLNYQDHVRTDPKYLRPQELPYLRGDSSYGRNLLDWQPAFSFESLLDDMLSHYS